jgi:hypothetical protein
MYPTAAALLLGKHRTPYEASVHPYAQTTTMLIETLSCVDRKLNLDDQYNSAVCSPHLTVSVLFGCLPFWYRG